MNLVDVFQSERVSQGLHTVVSTGSVSGYESHPRQVLQEAPDLGCDPL